MHIYTSEILHIFFLVLLFVGNFFFCNCDEYCICATVEYINLMVYTYVRIQHVHAHITHKNVSLLLYGWASKTVYSRNYTSMKDH